MKAKEEAEKLATEAISTRMELAVELQTVNDQLTDLKVSVEAASGEKDHLGLEVAKLKKHSDELTK